MPETSDADPWEHKISRDGAFPLAVMKLRGFRTNAGAIEIGEPAEDGTMAIKFADRTLSLRPAVPTELDRASREVTVVELPVTAEPFDAQPGQPPVEVIPRRDHGRVQFTTTLSATSRGPCSIEVRD